MVKNLLSNAGNTSSAPGQGTQILHAIGKLNPHTVSIELVCLRARVPQ